MLNNADDILAVQLVASVTMPHLGDRSSGHLPLSNEGP